MTTAGRADATTDPVSGTPPRAARRFPAGLMAAVGIGTTWICVAAAETLLSGGQDALDDVGMIADNQGVIATAGLLHWAAGLLLILGLAGAASLIWPSATGRVGWFLTVPLAGGLGAFGMLHLLALETAAPGLDAPAMNAFLVERLGEGSGPWTIPVLFVALLGPVAFAVFLIGLARVRRGSWVALGVFVVGAIVHAVVAIEIVETLSVWTMAAGGVLAAISALRTRNAPPTAVTGG